MRPYFLMVLLYFTLAVLAAVDAALTGMQILPGFNGIRWLRIHFITLGAVTQAVFGLLPALVAAYLKKPSPAMRWDIWISLNAGLLVLLVGIPLFNAVLIITGGTLIFIATLLLIALLRDLRPFPEAANRTVSEGRKFYLAGLGYLLVGIIVGSGLWFGWAEWLRIEVPIEVHIHANNWGFMSLIFAGLLIDLYPRFSGRSLAWPRSVTPIYWMMVLGALGLVLGPWFKSNWFSVPGLVLHLAATIWLLANVIRPVIRDRQAWTPGMFHLVTAYAWILAPVLIAPLIIANVPGFPGAGIEANAPQALIYGWVLQFGYALLPFIFRRALLPGEPARLGGSWLSLLAIHTGSAFLWASIFIEPYRGLLHGVAYGFWALSMLPVLLQLFAIISAGLARQESESFIPPPADRNAPAD